jgi:hypothetical protein
MFENRPHRKKLPWVNYLKSTRLRGHTVQNRPKRSLFSGLVVAQNRETLELDQYCIRNPSLQSLITIQAGRCGINGLQ